MRIGINASFRMHGGGMVHLKSLLGAWQDAGVGRQHRIFVFTRPESIGALGLDAAPDIDACPVDLGRGKLFWEQLAFPALLARYNLDVLFCPGGIVPIRCRVPAVMMVQNAAPFSSAVTLRLVGPYNYAYFRAFAVLARASAAAAARVIFISRFFQREFERRYAFPTNRADVIYHGRDSLETSPGRKGVLEELGIRDPYILSVSHLYPYKNIPALIEGYSLAREALRRRSLRLVLVGKAVSKTHERQLRRTVSRLALDDYVLITGAVPHADVGPLLRNCEFLAFQSTCENCPNTLIEALAAGVPIACSNAGVMPEIAGDAALYFDPFDPASIARCLTRLAEDTTLRNELHERALRQAQSFPTWTEVGKLTLKSLEMAADSPRRAAMGMS